MKQLRGSRAFWLFLLVCAIAPWTKAWAVTTPKTYCASLAATSCEVLNVELSASAGTEVVGLIKYCRNQDFIVMPIVCPPPSSNQFSCYYARSTWFSGGDITLSSSDPNFGSNTKLCTNLP